MLRKNEWSVLVVDDQVNVVDGLICSVHWEDIHVKSVHKAYSAMEAKTILLQNEIDIMLCDIEMPRENGLQLLKWIREKKINVECIFLTAHADFAYAKSAIQLDSFDYILQPARYIDVENAILRAEKKGLVRMEQEKYYSYGKALFDNKNQIMDGLLLDWYTEPDRQDMQKKVRDYLTKMEIGITEETVFMPVLMEIIEWKAGSWERELFRSSCINILEELLLDGQALFCWLKDNLWCILLWSKTGQIKQEEGLAALDKFQSVGTEFFFCNMALYAGEKVLFSRIGQEFAKLSAVKANNVAQKRGLFTNGKQKSNLQEMSEELLKDDAEENRKTDRSLQPDHKTWETMLVKGYGKEVCEEALSYLEELTEQDRLDAYALRSFYNDFVRVLVYAEEKTGVRHEDIFPTREQMDNYLNAYTTLSSMKMLLQTVGNYFTRETEDKKKEMVQIEQAKEYIYHNLDQDIRREDIAAVVYMNPSYLSRIFKKKEGISLKEFIIQEKMKMAQVLLKTSSLPINIVALKVGYSNFSYFSQVYKKTCGISPTDERKCMEESENKSNN